VAGCRQAEGSLVRRVSFADLHSYLAVRQEQAPPSDPSLHHQLRRRSRRLASAVPQADGSSLASRRPAVLSAFVLHSCPDGVGLPDSCSARDRCRRATVSSPPRRALV